MQQASLLVRPGAGLDGRVHDTWLVDIDQVALVRQVHRPKHGHQHELLANHSQNRVADSLAEWHDASKP